MKQSKWGSFIESFIQVAIGYFIAILTQIIIFPLFGFHADPWEHMIIGMIFLLVSLARSYIIRRVFERFGLFQKNS